MALSSVSFAKNAREAAPAPASISTAVRPLDRCGGLDGGTMQLVFQGRAGGVKDNGLAPPKKPALPAGAALIRNGSL